MVHSNKTKKFVHRYLSSKNVPTDLVNYILSFENTFQDLLPTKYHHKHAEFITGTNRWTGIDYYCGVKFLTYYTITRKPPDLSFDERKQEYRGLDVGEKHAWIAISWNHRCPIQFGSYS